MENEMTGSLNVDIDKALVIENGEIKEDQSYTEG